MTSTIIWHKANGPAYKSGDEFQWYFNGQLHRYYGPAFNRGSWVIHGKLITK